MTEECNIGLYKPLTLEELKNKYPCLKVDWVGSAGKSARNTTLVSGSGQRFVFFVVGDGSQSLLYYTTGWGEVVRNALWTFKEVVDAKTSEVHEGRIRYIPKDGTEWVDVGPVTKRGSLPTDPAFDVARKKLLRSREVSKPKTVVEKMEEHEQADSFFSESNDW